MSTRINRDDVDKLHDYGIHIPSRTVFLETSLTDDGDEHGVGYAMLQRVAKNLHVLDTTSADDINLVINTCGGDETMGMGVYDAIKACRSRVIGTVVGQASSMGCVILQACDIRQARPSALIMYHAGTAELEELPYHEAQKAFLWKRQFGDEIVDPAVFERMRAMRPELSWQKFRQMMERGLYLTSLEAVEWGLIDAVTEPAS